MAKEIELKFNLLNKDEVVSFLEASAIFVKESRELDIYYNIPNRNFLEKDPVNERLRLRKSDKWCAITYKNWHEDEPVCDEYEEQVQDIENMEKIFDAINITEIVRVDKTRKVWEYKWYTICVDSVVGLGDFIELESVQEWDYDLAQVKEDLYSLKDELKIQTNWINKTWYPYDLMKKKGLV